MLLVAKVGNTHTVLGLWDRRIVETWRIGTQNVSTEDELFVHINNFFDYSGHKFHEIDGICVASVVPHVNDTFRYFSKKHLKRPLLFVRSKDADWIKWNVLTPNEMGADRVANIIAASKKYAKNFAVVDFGTAITVEAFTDVYEGGSILPGPKTAIRALFANTAKLPVVEEEIPVSVVGKDTQTNIQSGVMIGTMVAIDGLIQLYEADLGCHFHVISTGGYGGEISKMSTRIEEYVPDLTLNGIALYYLELTEK